MPCDDEELNLGALAHLFVMSWSQKADEDGGSICLTMVLAGVVGSLTGIITFKDTRFKLLPALVFDDINVLSPPRQTAN